MKTVLTVLGLIAVVVAQGSGRYGSSRTAFPIVANCLMKGPEAMGNVTFTQRNNGEVNIDGRICNMAPGSMHGFHIHATGDLSGGCATAGAHFNPYNKTHGAEEDRIRHAGDLGNIQAGSDGCAEFTKTDYVISLDKYRTAFIVGRACVVHSQRDDLGRGNNPDSKLTGNSGTRIGCGVVGYVSVPSGSGTQSTRSSRRY